MTDQLKKLVVYMLAVPAQVTFSGHVLTVLWAWFMVPTFGVALLSIPQAIGLGLVVAYFRNHSSDDKEKTSNEIDWEGLTRPYVKGLLLLGVGWVVRAFFLA